MTKRIIWSIVLILLLAIVPLNVLLTGAGLPSYYQDSYYAELPAMFQRLRDTEDPKIVIIGGSNVAFGVDVPLLEEILSQYGYDYTVCPFGLYGAVGTSVMLELSKDSLNSGDMVILAIEPTSESHSTYFGASAFWKCAEEAPELLFQVSTQQRAALAGNYLTYLQERYAFFFNGTSPEVEGVYAKSSFDEHCSMVYDRAGNTMALGFDTTAPVDLATVTIGSDFAQQVNEYCAFARDKGVSVCLSFSPVNRSSMTDTSYETVLSYFERCCEAFDCLAISDPHKFIYDSGWFYDSNFHLNSAGAILRTRNLAQDILCQLGCTQTVTYPVPDMPDPIAHVTQTLGDTDSFLFAPLQDQAGSILGYWVSGLTEEGLKKSKLTVPSFYEGLPVVGFTSEALSGATVLEELTVPASVEGLPDSLFLGCSKLTRLVLEHIGTVCDVTGHTFDGAAQVRVYVPADTYHLYRDGQGCKTNPWKPYLDRIYTY